MKKQIDASAYTFQQYMHHERWNSIYFQVKGVLALTPNSVLEVGPGHGTFQFEMKQVPELI